MRRLLTLTVLVSALAACIQFPEEDAAVHAALEYELDRLEVLGFQVSPPYFVSDETVTLDALVLGPSGAAETVAVRMCGLRTDLTVDVDDVGCFEDQTLVSEVAADLPAAWTTPDLTGAGCSEGINFWEDTGITDTASLVDPDFLGERTPYAWRQCYSEVPLLLEASGDGETAWGYAQVKLLHHPLSDLEQIVVGDFIVDRELTVTVTGTPTAGGTVELAASLPTLNDDPFLVFRWSVDAGELRGTSRTLNHVSADGITTSYNQLTIPEDYSGALRVAVVVSRQYASAVGDEIWTLETLEVP